MASKVKRDALADAVMVGSKVVWAPPIEPGMPCRAMAHGFGVRARIVEVLDPADGSVMVLADPGQDCTATQGDETWRLFTPGEPFRVKWEQGLAAVQRADGRWERPVLEVIREKCKAVPGWKLSDAVRCDPAYRNRTTGGGVQGEGGRYVGRGENGARIDRRRWTTTLRPDALEVLRALAEANGIDRNEVVERLLLNPAGLAAGNDEGPATTVVSARVSDHLGRRIAAAAAAEGVKPSAWLRSTLARLLP
jgi:hypothetical protein